MKHYMKSLFAEIIKTRRTSEKRLMLFMPFIIMAIAFIFGRTSQYFGTCAWNWLYAFLYPVFISLVSALSIRREKRLKFRTIYTMPNNFNTFWISKINAIALLCLKSLILFLVLLYGASRLFGFSMPLPLSAAAVAVLFLTLLWQIPLFLWIGAKFGMFTSVLVSGALNIIIGVFNAESPLFYLNPFAIPVRLMYPLLHIRANGLILPVGDALESAAVIVPGLAVCLLLFIAVTFLSSRWFARLEE